MRFRELASRNLGDAASDWLASLAGLIGLALFTWWLAELLAPLPDVAKPVVEHSVDYYALKFLRTEMNEDGSPKTRLSAAAMHHYADDNTSELSRPLLLLYNKAAASSRDLSGSLKDAPPWVVRSDVGNISGDGDTIFLGGKVLLTRDAYDKSNALEVVSKDVTVHMDENYLLTEAYTEIFNHPQYTSGTGMRTDFAEGMQTTLLSEVRGRYEF